LTGSLKRISKRPKIEKRRSSASPK
jgi:hypothetical protein